MRPSAATLSSQDASLLYRWKAAVTVLVVLSFSFHFCKYDDRVALCCVRVPSTDCQSSAECMMAKVVCVNKLPGNCDRQVVGVDVKNEGSQDRSLRDAVFRTS